MTNNMDMNNGANPVLKDHFEFGQVLGEGAFGQVRLCKHRATDVQYAAKILKKESLIKKSQTKYVKSERDILLALNHPNVLRLFFTFADEKRLYFITELISGGELFVRIKKKKKLSKHIVQFYMAELLEAILYIHSKNVVHRDLKPENLLLSGDGHLKLVDFGIAKIIAVDGMHTFCGTVEYLAPEIVANNEYGKGPSMTITCQKIADRDIYWPNELPDDAKDLIDKLLTVDISKRLGCGSGDSFNAPENIRKHKFFEGINFAELRNRTPPIVPDELGYDGPCGTGLNISMYDMNRPSSNPVDEDLLLRCRVIPLPFFHNDKSNACHTQGNILDTIRRSKLLRQLYPELSKLPNRPNPVVISNSDISSEVHIKSNEDVESNSLDTVNDEEVTPPIDRPNTYEITFRQTVANIGTPVRCLAWSSCGEKLAASGGFILKTYGIGSDSNTQIDLLRQENTVSSASFLFFSPDGQSLAFDCKRHVGILRQKSEKRTSNWNSMSLVGHSMPITRVSWAPDNLHLAAGGLDGSIYLWDVKKQKCHMRWDNHRSHIHDLSWQRCSNSSLLPLLGSAGADGKLIIYDPNSNNICRRLPYHLGFEALGVRWSPRQESLLLSYGSDRTMVLTDTKTWKPIREFASTTPVLRADWSPNGRYLATVSHDVIRIWDMTMMKILKVLNRDGHSDYNLTSSADEPNPSAPPVNSTALAFDHTSTRLACTTSNYDKSPVVFDMASNTLLSLQASETHREPITCMEWSSTRSVLATGSLDNTIALWGLDHISDDLDDIQTS